MQMKEMREIEEDAECRGWSGCGGGRVGGGGWGGG